MARKVRVEYPGAVYHLTNREDQGQLIFRSEADCVLWLETLSERCEKTGWQIHACVLMESPGVETQARPGGVRRAMEANLAWWLRKRTVISRGWIARKLVMGDASPVTQARLAVQQKDEPTILRLRRRLERLDS